MNISFECEKVNLSRRLSEHNSQTLVESDIILPGNKRDIKNILQIDGNVYVSDKLVQKGNIKLSGRLCLNVLYVPEGEGSSVCSFFPQIDFEYSIEAGAEGENNIFASFDIQHIEYNLINGRNISLKAVIGVSAGIYELCENDIATNVISDECVEAKKVKKDVTNTVCFAEDEFVIRETLELPAGKAPIDEVLKIDVKVFEKNAQTISNKIVAKGNVNVCTLYCAHGGETIQFMEHEFDFTEVLEAPGVGDNMKVLISYYPKTVNYLLKEDNDGDNTSVEIEAVICASIRALKDMELVTIEDLFAPGYNTEIAKKDVVLEKISEICVSSVTCKDIADIPDDIPKIFEVYNVIGKSTLTNARVNGNRIEIEGVIDYCILYLTDSLSNPLYSFKKQTEFSQSLDCSGLCGDEGIVIDVLETLISYNLISNNQVDLRFNISIRVSQETPVLCSMVTDSNFSERNNGAEMPSLTVCFPGEEETLWDIARKYNVTRESICKMNGLSEDCRIKKGNQIIIPRFVK